MTVIYSTNEIKVYENSGLQLYQTVDLGLLESEYNEILNLLSLFATRENKEKRDILKNKKEHYDDLFTPKIKKARRLLKNTEKRVTYNLERC